MSTAVTTAAPSSCCRRRHRAYRRTASSAYGCGLASSSASPGFRFRPGTGRVMAGGRGGARST